MRIWNNERIKYVLMKQIDTYTYLYCNITTTKQSTYH